MGNWYYYYQYYYYYYQHHNFKVEDKIPEAGVQARYLIFDVIVYEGNAVGFEVDFAKRLRIIEEVSSTTSFSFEVDNKSPVECNRPPKQRKNTKCTRQYV
jgi:hypothetical protein